MRAFIAPAVVLSCALRIAGQIPATFSEWESAYQSAVAASQRHSDDEALTLFEKSWQTAGDDEQRGLAADGLAVTTRRLGRVNEAKTWIERAIEAFRKDPKQSLRFAVTTASLADTDRGSGNYPAAEAVLRSALDSDVCDAESRAFLRNNLADLLREEGRSLEARRLFRQTLGSPDLPLRERISSLIGLADIDREQGAWESSISQWNEALESARREKNEPAEAIILRGLGQTWLQSGAAARAEPLLKKSLWIMNANPGVPSEEVAASHAAMAELYRSENKLALAENEWMRALEIDRPVLGENHPQTAILMEMLADVYAARGDSALARDYAAKAADTMKRAFGESSMAVAAALTNQAAIEQRARALDSALRYFGQAVDIVRAHPESGSAGIAMIDRYAALLKAMHRSEQARAALALRKSLMDNKTTLLAVN